MQEHNFNDRIIYLKGKVAQEGWEEEDRHAYLSLADSFPHGYNSGSGTG